MRTIEHICALCGETIPKADNAIRALDRFLLDQCPSPKSYKTTIMHQHCFQIWEHRKLYIRLFNRHHQSVAGDLLLRMKSNGSIEHHWRWRGNSKD